MPDFESNTIEFDTLRTSEQAVMVCGPAVASVGWIPFYADLADMPTCDYKSHVFAKPRIIGVPLSESSFVPAAMSVLFGSGNPSGPVLENNPSPASFSDRAQFLKLVASKNYRAALALDDVKAVFGEDGRPVELSYKHIGEVGFTPMRIQSDSLLITYYDKGRGSTDIEVSVASGSIRISQYARFKLGSIADFGCFVLSGRFAPSAQMRIDFVILKDGHLTIEFYGSFIPSQSHYVNWSRSTLHDMVGNSREVIDGFLTAGRCQDAPIKRHETWQGMGISSIYSKARTE
jgi:hypothetical protein